MCLSDKHITDWCAYAGGQTPCSQAGTVEALWAILYVQSCNNCGMTLMREDQTSKAIPYGLKALAVGRAAKLQGSLLYAALLERMLIICLRLRYAPTLGFRQGDHAISYEGLVDAAAHVKQKLEVSSRRLAQLDSFILEHESWVQGLQAELVRCKGPASFRLYCSHL